MGNNSIISRSPNLRFRSFQYSLKIIKFIDTFPNKRIFWNIGDQLLRSATSIGANITEAKSSSSKREFVKYYEIALKSCNESLYWLDLLIDSYLLLTFKSELLLLKNETEEMGKMLGASILTLKGRRKH